MTGIDFIGEIFNLGFLTCAAHGYDVTGSEEDVEIFNLEISKR